MIDIIIDRVHNGWAYAEIGPPDQVEYEIHGRDATLDTYGSIRRFIDLYECALREESSSEYPVSTGFDLVESEDCLTLSMGLETFQTTYSNLRAESRDALREIFRQLDGNSTPGEREQALPRIARGRDWIDTEALYDEIVE